MSGVDQYALQNFLDKQEGLNKIINHIDCPEDLRGLLT